ncbi:TPA: hypothetical protein DEP34_03705 [Candidatus Uhrbacteria bacterium]|nr:hypothetical protein [Candidatus Uhrbacteria bacterium]HCB19461.1 hypothetical protein [Candidatus Uhrbacteria bacterium]
MLHKQSEVENLLKSINDTMPEDKKLNIPAIVGSLVAMGAGVEAVAKEMSFEEIGRAADIPPSIARPIAKLWRATPEVPASPASETRKPGLRFGEVELSGAAELALAIGQVTGLNDATLLANYDPMGRDDIVRELGVRAGQKPFIVYTDKPALRIDVGLSLEFLRLIKQGVDVGNFTTIGGKTVELYRAGALPDRALDICPIHGCHLINGFCGQCHQSWEGTSEEMRKLAYLQIKEVWEGKVPTHDDPRIPLLFVALKAGAEDAYWSDAKMFLEKYNSTGQVIVLVKPITSVPMRPQGGKR